MRLIFLGSGAFACPTLRWLAQSEHAIPLVVTQPAREAGRGRRSTPTPVAEMARELRLDVFEVNDINTPEAVARVRSLDARLGVVIAFGQKLKRDLLDVLPAGCINLHASLLPKYRGAAPINWAIVRGERRTGCTVFRIVEKMDAGPILSTRWTYIKPEETAGELHDRLAGVGVDAVQAALEQFTDDAIPEGEPQDHSEATIAPKLKKSDGVIDWARPVEAVVQHILGMTPWPGAGTRYCSDDGRWEKVTIARARVAEDPATIMANRNGVRDGSLNGLEMVHPAEVSVPLSPKPEPGTIDARRFVAAGDGFVEILEIKPSSGRIMTWREYINGRRVGAGDRFES